MVMGLLLLGGTVPMAVAASRASNSLMDSGLLHVLAVGDLHLDLLEFLDGRSQMIGEPLEDLLALLGGGPERITDHAVGGHLLVLHREVEVLVALEFHVGAGVDLLER